MTPGRVLLLVCHGTERALLQNALRQAGFEVTAQATLRSALDALERSPFGAVISDWRCPDGVALPLLRTVRGRSDASAGIPVILLTSEAHPPALTSTAEFGPDAVLLKPVTVAQLLARLTHAMQRYHALLPLWQQWTQPDLVTLRPTFDAVLRASQRHRRAAKRLFGRLLERLGAWDEAERFYREALAAAPPPPWAQLGLARVLAAREQWSEAQALLVPLLERHPRFLAANDELARAHMMQGNSDAAASLWLRSASAAPFNSERLQLAIPTLLETGHQEAASSLLRQVLAFETAPDPELTLLAIEALADRGEWEQAKALAQPLLAQAKTPLAQALAHFAWFRIAFRQGASTEAQDHLRLALSYAVAADPLTFRPWLSRLLTAALADAVVAEEAKALAYRLNAASQDASARRWLHHTLRRLGHETLVEQIENELSAAARNEIAKGIALARRGEWQAAIEAMHAAAERLPGSAAIHYNLTLVWLRALETGAVEAKEALNRAQRALTNLQRLAPTFPYLEELQSYWQRLAAAANTAGTNIAR